jgi:peptide/nickel transport system permease protein
MLAAPGVGAMERVREYEELRGVADPAIVANANRAGLGVVFWVCLAWVGAMALLAIFAGFLHLIQPNFQNYNVVNAGPSTAHLLGTDDLGRDLLSRVIYGSRVSFVIGFASVGIALVIGGALGLLAGYAGGWIDSILNAGSLVILAFPALLAILVIEAFWKPTTLLKLTIMFAVAGIPSLFRVIRATTLSFASREFVVAARTMGASTWRILVKELLPNVIPAAISFALIGVAVAIILEGSLAFLGLSISLPTSSLGNIINEGVQNNNLSINPLIALWPSIYIFLLLLALNLMADRLRSRFDVRAGNL